MGKKITLSTLKIRKKDRLIVKVQWFKLIMILAGIIIGGVLVLVFSI